MQELSILVDYVVGFGVAFVDPSCSHSKAYPVALKWTRRWYRQFLRVAADIQAQSRRESSKKVPLSAGTRQTLKPVMFGVDGFKVVYNSNSWT